MQLRETLSSGWGLFGNSEVAEVPASFEPIAVERVLSPQEEKNIARARRMGDVAMARFLRDRGEMTGVRKFIVGERAPDGVLPGRFSSADIADAIEYRNAVAESFRVSGENRLAIHAGRNLAE